MVRPLIESKPPRRYQGLLQIGVLALAALACLMVASLMLWVDTPAREFAREIDELMAIQQFAEARALLESEASEDMALAELALRLGSCQSLMDDYDAAERTFDIALAVHPDDERLLYNRALLDYRQRRLDAAMTRLQHLVEVAPYFPGVRYHIARIFERQGQPEQALTYYVAELNLDPHSSSSWRRYQYLKRELEIQRAEAAATRPAESDK